jgi:hypothetical protein
MSRFRPRISLLTALLLMTILALVLVIVQLGRKLGPLTAEVHQLRQYAGHLSIDDASRIQAIEVRQPDPNLWRWRLYLPPGRQYKLLQFGGHLPPRRKLSNKDWLAELRKAPVQKSEMTSDEFEGEFPVETTFTSVGDTWKLEMSWGDTISTARYTFQDNWPAKHRHEESDIWPRQQRIFEPGEPILLLYLSKPALRRARGEGISSSVPAEPPEGIALWIEPPPAEPGR